MFLHWCIPAGRVLARLSCPGGPSPLAGVILPPGFPSDPLFPREARGIPREVL